MRLHRLTASVLIGISLSGCAAQNFEFASASLDDGEAPFVHEPLSGGEEFPVSCRKNSQTSQPHYGLQATAYHSANGINSSLDAIRVGTKINRSYRFDALLVPSRESESGFPIMGDLLRNDNGDVLKTYYALDLYSGLSLSPADEEGYYQFAVLSDDGTTLHLMDETSKYVPVLSDEGEHAPRVSCAPKAIYMKRGATVPFRLTYFQGPATKIALTVIWRRWNSADPTGATSRCNTSPEIFEADGRTLVRELRDSGWKALGQENYISSGSSEVCYYHGD